MSSRSKRVTSDAALRGGAFALNARVDPDAETGMAGTGASASRSNARELRSPTSGTAGRATAGGDVEGARDGARLTAGDAGTTEVDGATATVLRLSSAYRASSTAPFVAAAHVARACAPSLPRARLLNHISTCSCAYIPLKLENTSEGRSGASCAQQPTSSVQGHCAGAGYYGSGAR